MPRMMVPAPVRLVPGPVVPREGPAKVPLRRPLARVLPQGREVAPERRRALGKALAQRAVPAGRPVPTEVPRPRQE